MYINLRRIAMIGVLFSCIAIIGCGTNTKTNDYSYCNKNSNGKMAENEDGYFYVFEQYLYYADKNNLDQWVVVCNKPDCFHTSMECNGYLQTATRIWQKNNGLYETTKDIKEQELYIYEMKNDGSGAKKIHEIPIEAFPSGYNKATFQERFIISYRYLDEQGQNQERIISIENDEDGEVNIYSLYESEVDTIWIASGNEFHGIRGDNVLVTTLYLEEGKNPLHNFCKVNNQKIEPLNIPEDISFENGYLSGDVFIYYNQQEGFYQYDLCTGEKKLIFENQLGDGQGYILSEEYMIECNRYLDYTPEDAQLKVYNGEEWIDIEVPEEIATCNDPFEPVCIASDRIFFKRNVRNRESGRIVGTHLYYMMLDEENPELIMAGKIGAEVEESSSEEEITTEENSGSGFKKVTVWENDEYVFQVTDVYVDSKNRCCIDFYFENNSDDKKYEISGSWVTINGIQCNTSWGTGTIKPNENKIETLCFVDDMVDTSKVSEFYSGNEYTDIGVHFLLNVYSTENKYLGTEEKSTHIYPQGEENITVFKRELAESDKILVDNEYVSVIVTGYEKNFVPNDTIQVLIENKTDRFVAIEVEEAAANDIAVTPSRTYGVYWTVASPGAIVMYPMTLFDGSSQGGSPEGPYQLDPDSTFLHSNNITSIDTIEFKLGIMDYTKYSHDSRIEPFNIENFVYETFVLNP